jgi:hypothetical protein
VCRAHSLQRRDPRCENASRDDRSSENEPNAAETGAAKVGTLAPPRFPFVVVALGSYRLLSLVKGALGTKQE